MGRNPADWVEKPHLLFASFLLDIVNVESDDISRSKIVLYQRAVNVYCIACNGLIGERFTELTPPYPRIMEGSYLFHRNWMLYWNGTQLRRAIGAVDDRPP
ncbi:hypothetical protein Goshw_002011 [Gossypium schwendimanii]|uniref:Yippee domain-containing protein n=1 Tax=Gossypium schwendimanii TaxID=34291 RepID=A0A7J9KVV9_GOSSC|nr:hypothetical protein [Gossypium schwendimanii]